MPILDLEHRLREVGRIRLGARIEAVSKNGKQIRRPVKLDTFKLTSRDEQIIQRAAGLYGGTAEPWPDQEGQWQVTTAVDDLAVIVPPAHTAFSQWYEEWSGGGCRKRCDGRRDVLRDCPCDCDPEHRACQIHTRLSVMLPDLPGLGVWRVDTQGYYAAVELGGAVEVASAAAERGQMLPARLRLEQRKVLRDGKTHKFATPVLDLDVSPAQLLAAPDTGPAIAAANSAGALPDATGSTQEPGELPAPATDTTAEPVDATKPAPKPRSARADHATPGQERVCSRCGQAYGDLPVVRGGDGESRFVHRDCKPVA